MEAYGLEPQVALTTPLLLGTDGEKMSKSKGNTIGLTDAPEEQFGRTMRISDELLPDYYRLVMERDPAEIGDDPMEAKLRARSLRRRPLARGERRRGGRGALRPGCPSPRGARGRAVHRALGRGRRRRRRLPAGHAGQIHGDLVGERGEAADRPGGRQAGRSARRRAQRAGGAAGGIASCRQASVGSRPSCRRVPSPEIRFENRSGLTSGGVLLSFFGCLTGQHLEVCPSSTKESSSVGARDRMRLPGASAKSGAFFMEWPEWRGL